MEFKAKKVMVYDEYSAHNRTLRINSTRIGSILVFVLMPAGISLDYFVYPDLLFEMLLIRLLYLLVPVVTFIASYTAFGRKHIVMFGIALALTANLAMSIMILISEGTNSPYYAGLNLVILGVGVFMPWRTREVLSLCIITMIIYLCACLLHTKTPMNWSIFYNNLYFLALTTIICVVSSYYVLGRRFQEFRLRHELVNALNQLKETEAKLIQSEKMRGLGHLAAGLIHEINNPLNNTLMAIHSAKKKVLPSNKELKMNLDHIQEGMTRISHILSDLRTFAHPGGEALGKLFRFKETLEIARRLAAHELEGISIVHDPAADCQVSGSMNQIIHVIMNLLVNSARAFRDIPSDRLPEVRLSTKVEGDRVRVRVQDNGTGIKEDDLSKIFDPFFTTREVGEGMGLGLSICHTIIKNHGGTISVESREGKGTTVTFDLPLGGENHP